MDEDAAADRPTRALRIVRQVLLTCLASALLFGIAWLVGFALRDPQPLDIATGPALLPFAGFIEQPVRRRVEQYWARRGYPPRR